MEHSLGNPISVFVFTMFIITPIDIKPFHLAGKHDQIVKVVTSGKYSYKIKPIIKQLVINLYQFHYLFTTIIYSISNELRIKSKLQDNEIKQKYQILSTI